MNTLADHTTGVHWVDRNRIVYLCCDWGFDCCHVVAGDRMTTELIDQERRNINIEALLSAKADIPPASLVL